MSSDSDADTSKGRILIVDDTPANLLLLMKMLTNAGYLVHPVDDGRLALRFIEHTLPDLILLDILMPDMNGYEVCRALKNNPHSSEVPVIFLSAAGEVLNKMDAFAVGGIDYIVKPFHAEEVLARIRTHLSLRQLQQRLEERVKERTAELGSANSRLEQINSRLATEVSERRRAEQHIRYLAHHDPLTGLPNRTLLEDRVVQAIAQAERSHQYIAMLFLDLDFFKRINDSLGHQVGDRVLQAVAMRLQQCVRKGDSIARLGGDEFALALPALTDHEDAALVADKILQIMKQPFEIDGHELHVSGSIGISFYPRDGADAQDLLRTADTAMYYAKACNRGNYQHFTPALNATIERRLTMENQLREALARGEFTLYYQPQVTLGDGRIRSAEALLRWCKPEAEPIPCEDFIAVAEDTGLILALGEWALEQACEQLTRWHQAGHEDLGIAVNLSARQLYRHGFQDSVKRILEASGVPAGMLELEITESLLIHPSSDNLNTLKQLDEMGIQLAIDDFGVGYSSLTYLRRFPIHTVKIDRSFVSGIEQDRHDTAIVTGILAIARSLGLKIIAEGVETAKQARFLKDHGCPAAQGYYYSKPIPADQFASLLRNQTALPWRKSQP
ncbi:MAG: EAL domain-containing protein [Aquisalimonadaceae bacterium]